MDGQDIFVPMFEDESANLQQEEEELFIDIPIDIPVNLEDFLPQVIVFGGDYLEIPPEGPNGDQEDESFYFEQGFVMEEDEVSLSGDQQVPDNLEVVGRASEEQQAIQDQVVPHNEGNFPFRVEYTDVFLLNNFFDSYIEFH